MEIQLNRYAFFVKYFKIANLFFVLAFLLTLNSFSYGQVIVDEQNDVGIGVENPERKLEVDGTAKADEFEGELFGTASGENTINFQTDGVVKLQIDGIGRLVPVINSEKTQIFIGKGAGNLNTSNQNVFIGTNAGQIAIGDFNTYIGDQAGRGRSVNFPNSGSHNVFVGEKSGYFNETGSNNILIGGFSGMIFKGGSNNNCFGYQAGRGRHNPNAINSGSNNNFLGHRSGYGNLTGENNNYLGNDSGFFATIGTDNNFLGFKAGHGKGWGNPNSGSHNNFFGHKSGTNNSSGSHNFFLGYESGIKNTSGENNIFIGKNAGDSQVTGSNNIAIGQDADISNGVENSIAIGAGVIVSQNNKIVIGSGNQCIEMVAACGSPSDSRFKENVKKSVPGLNFISQLRPVTYNFNFEKMEKYKLGESFSSSSDDKYDNEFSESYQKVRTGFIAQEVEEICEKINYEFDGLIKPEEDNPTSTYSLSYATFVVPLVQAVQEQQSEIEKLRTENEVLQKQLEQIISRLSHLEANSK